VFPGINKTTSQSVVLKVFKNIYIKTIFFQKYKKIQFFKKKLLPKKINNDRATDHGCFSWPEKKRIVLINFVFLF